MRRRVLDLLLVLVCGTLLLAGHLPAEGCTSFVIAGDESLVVGKGYDWMVGAGLVMVNRAGVRKPFPPATAEDRNRHWVSRYGSVTFNQYGRDNPQGGINQQGLVVEILWLSETEYEAVDQRPALGATGWIQYQLDTAAGVDEVIASFAEVRIASSATVHYLVADRHGQVATVEFLAGEPVCHRGGALPAPVLTNSTYAGSLASLRQYSGWGGDQPLPTGGTSLERFARAAKGVQSFTAGKRSATDHAFEVLDSVAHPELTMWQIAYDLVAMKVTFRTRSSPSRKVIGLASLDFSCTPQPIEILDIDLEHPGNVAGHWQRYSTRANRELIERAYNGTSFLQNVPAEARDRLARRPERTACVTGR